MSIRENSVREDFVFNTAAGERAAILLSPLPGVQAEQPLLLVTLAMGAELSLFEEPYNITAQAFVEQGHRTVSFSLPHHGERIGADGEGITGFRNAFVQGRDDFAAFVEECKAVIDSCIEKGFGVPGRIVVAGTSRAGYLAARALAADERILAGAAFAPVTDWRKLSEFAADTGRVDVADLKLSNYADALSGKPFFFVIGNHDARVSTASCVEFYIALEAANVRDGHGDSHINFQVHDVPGHASQDEWYIAAADFLIRTGSSAEL